MPRSCQSIARRLALAIDFWRAARDPRGHMGGANEVMRSGSVLSFVRGVVALGLWLVVAVAAAKDSKKTKPSADKATSSAPSGVTPNACGCYAKGNGCACTSKKGKCDCPGECEPVGCAEKRDKEMEKEAADAVKRAQDDDKRREDAETKRLHDEEEKRQAAESADSQPSDDDKGAAESAPAEPSSPAKGEKGGGKPGKSGKAGGKAGKPSKPPGEDSGEK